MSKKIVRSRFEEDLDETVNHFLAGNDILYDTILIPYDLFNNIAHHLMLNKIGAISDQAIKPILKSMKAIFEQWESGEFELLEELEDVHMNIEYAVTEKVGQEIGGRMHLARSRNDQVLTDLRLFMRDETLNVQKMLIELIDVLIVLADDNLETLFIGYTHTQQAQPLTFAHWCMAHVDALFRDLKRLSQTYERINANPLGAAAIAGTSWAIDRVYTADLLGFDGIQENTLDVISSRGEFTGDLLAVFATIMTHLGRIAEDIILNSTSEFGVITLSDKFSTGSSIMPQKKNPDVLELIRAKAGVINGNLLKVFGILKGLPSGYNRDHQELKEALFFSIETVKLSIKVLAGLISTMKINTAVLEERLENSFIMATELVDLLVKQWNIPFRTAYTIIANYIKENQSKLKFDPNGVAEFIKKAKDPDLEEISVEQIKGALDPLETIKRRAHIGGPAPQEEKRMIQERKKNLEKTKEKVLNLEKKINEVFNQLLELVDKKITE